jgi:hypothetical protein
MDVLLSCGFPGRQTLALAVPETPATIIMAMAAEVQAIRDVVGG